MADDKPLSHAEMWDDSMLVKSWDDAFAEYQKYHSLALKGEKVRLEDIRSAAKSNGGTETTPSAEHMTEKPISHATERAATMESIPTTSDPVPSVSSATGLPSVPVALMSTVQDQDMKNLMMSWYYAGYYTGLYEGKQQVLAEIQAPET